MNFEYKEKALNWQGADLTRLCAEISQELQNTYAYSGPYFLYHEGVLKERLEKLVNGLPSHCRYYYSVKSLSNISVLKKIAAYPSFGLDVVSGGEILRGILAGYKGEQMVFAGVGKTEKEIVLGLQKNIRSFHVESLSEMRKIARTAISLGKVANVALRVNPDIEVDTHKYITTGKEENKFGISAREIDEALEIIKESASLKLVGLQCHFGSQILDARPYRKALDFLIAMAKDVESKLGVKPEYLSLGGGFGIDYTTPNGNAKEFPIEELNKALADYDGLPYELCFEPGRFISAYSGILVTRILYIKEKTDFSIAICNAGISELIRPALYGSEHPILPLERKEGADKTYDYVGPICESTDFIQMKVDTPPVEEGDEVAVLHSGAYAAVMSSNYNTRALAPEIITDGKSFKIIRKPQQVSELLNLEDV